MRCNRTYWKILTSTWTRTFLVENVWTSWKNLGVGLGLGYTSIVSFHTSSTHFINATHRHKSTTIYTYINSFRVLILRMKSFVYWTVNKNNSQWSSNSFRGLLPNWMLQQISLDRFILQRMILKIFPKT